MSEPYPYYAVYKLKGRAAEAAAELVALRRDHPAERKRVSGIMSAKDRNIMQRDIMDEIDRRAKESVMLLRLKTPAVQIEKHTEGYPRAYEQFPHISEAETDEGLAYFIFCPIDFRGNHCAPANAERVPDEKLITTDFGEIVHKDYGYLSPPLLTRNKAGTVTPQDFDPGRHRFREEGIDGYGYKVFIAWGSSLSCVKEYLARKEALEKAHKDVPPEVERVVTQLERNSLLGADEGDELEAQSWVAVNEKGKSEVWVRLTNKSRKDDMHPGHDSLVALKDNDHFIMTDYKNGAFRVKPNRETEAGQRMEKLFDKMLTKPDLGQYWMLWNPTAPKDLKDVFHSRSKEGVKVPRLETIRDVHYLVYLIDKKAEKDHCYAPGSIPVSTAEFLWLQADIKDEEENTRLPEPPRQIAHMQPVKPSLVL